MKQLQIETMVLGMMATNCYLALNKETKRLFIIDPAAEPERIISKIDALGAEPEAILLTHGHFDHIGAADALRDRYGIPVCALDEEQEICENPENNLSMMCGRSFTVKADRFFHDGETIELAGMQIRVLHTPGHTSGGACYYIPQEDVLFSGDTLFCGSVGRTDFPTGSMSSLRDSIHTRLFTLPEDTLVFPGHEESTDIGYEKRYNPY
ncbi:MAG: MBL fold metallo-hydrolase [Lachnospiraceae bacterium]|nr:MBL fold metallo-hydrolase [Lachnospiraceae bacterium]